jgi:hypothetical protein
LILLNVGRCLLVGVVVVAAVAADWLAPYALCARRQNPLRAAVSAAVCRCMLLCLLKAARQLP